MNPGGTNWIEVDDILTQIASAFSTVTERRALSYTNRQTRDVMTAARTEVAHNMMRNRMRYHGNRGERVNGLLRGAMTRHNLTKFPPVTSMDQKIRKVVPPFWILATAMSTHATGQERREHAAGHVGDRYEALGAPELGDVVISTPAERRIQAEAYLFIHYLDFPDWTLRKYFQSIADSSIHTGIDVTTHFNAVANNNHEATAPELLNLTFDQEDLFAFGY